MGSLSRYLSLGTSSNISSKLATSILELLEPTEAEGVVSERKREREKDDQGACVYTCT